MAELPINYLDTGKVARDKINDSFEALETTVAGYRPHIESGIRWIGDTNTGVKAVGDSISMKVEDGYIWYKSSSVNTWTQIIATSAIKGDTGNGIAHTSSSKSGKTTTVVMHYTNGGSDSFTVQDGEDGIDVGAVIGPDSSTDGDVVLFDGATGKLVKDSGVKLGTAATKDTGTTSGKIPVLDNDGKIDTTMLPALAITDTFTVTSSSDLTSLSSAEKGDIAIASSEGKTYILSADPYSTASNWKELATPTGGVSSVNTKTGAVVLDADDISDSTTTNKFVTASDITNLGNLSGVNTGDQSASDFDIKDLLDSTGLRTTWSGKQDAFFTSSSTAPSNPSEGDLWYDTVNDELKVYDGTQWNTTGGGGSGDVVGPASATDGHLAVFDGATGKLIKDGGAIPAGDVVVSSQANNILTSGMAIRCGEETDYANLGSYSNNTLYLTIPDQS